MDEYFTIKVIHYYSYKFALFLVEENNLHTENSQYILNILADAYSLNFVEGSDFRNNIIKKILSGKMKVLFSMKILI